MKPELFIASSVEGLDVAYVIQNLLQYDAECTVWDQGVFKPSSYTVKDLLTMLSRMNYGIFVFSAADDLVIRGEKEKAVRDNVLFELGMFMGVLGQSNCFIVMPNNDGDIHIPTDLIGINLLKYDNNRRDGNIKAALGPAVNEIKRVIKGKSKEQVTASKELLEQISSVGMRAFYSSRDDYSKYREKASSIDKYIERAHESICMVSVTLSTGIQFDDICKVFERKLKGNSNFRITISLLNPFNQELYRTIMPLFKQSTEALQNNTISALTTLKGFKNSLEKNEQDRFLIRVHQTLPFGSAIILDGDSKNGTIQIETKPYEVGMRKSFGFELANNEGEFFNTLKQSYEKLIKDGKDLSELPLDGDDKLGRT